MGNRRIALVGALALGAMLVSSAAAQGVTRNVAETTWGHARISISQVGGVSDVRTAVSIRACDDKFDHKGVVAFAIGGGTEWQVEDRRGVDTCGRARELVPTPQSFAVWVCRHNKSRFGPVEPDPTGSHDGEGRRDPHLERCRHELIEL
jgi:hypothetical protein